MSLLIENDIQRETRFVYEQANATDCATLEAPPPFKLPFPPPINPKDLVAQKKNGKVPSRSPNAFLIYRRVVVKELKAQNYAYKMTDVSSMASASWKNEPEHVKKAYLEIAGEAKNMLTDTRLKSLCFSQRKCHSNNTRTQKTKSSTTQSPRSKKQMTSTNTSPSQLSSHSFTQEPKQFIQSINIPQRTIEEDCQPLSPSFAICIEDVDSYLFSTNNREYIWTQSPVSDVLICSDGESSTSTDVGIDDIFDRPNLTPTSSVLDSQRMTITSYRQFLIDWHVWQFYGNISPIVDNGLNIYVDPLH